MVPDPAVTGSSGGGARGSGDDGEWLPATVHVSGDRTRLCLLFFVHGDRWNTYYL
jgi:hypothetical protein